jgi:hypothetical protein
MLLNYGRDALKSLKGMQGAYVCACVSVYMCVCWQGRCDLAFPHNYLKGWGHTDTVIPLCLWL